MVSLDGEHKFFVNFFGGRASKKGVHLLRRPFQIEALLKRASFRAQTSGLAFKGFPHLESTPGLIRRRMRRTLYVFAHKGIGEVERRRHRSEKPQFQIRDFEEGEKGCLPQSPRCRMLKTRWPLHAQAVRRMLTVGKESKKGISADTIGA